MGVASHVRIEIDELDLGAVSPARRFAVAAAFERELARLVATDGLPDGLGDAEERAAPSLGVRVDASPVPLGHALAHAVYQGLR
jgi:hypothetical protein